ncbi:TPA: hypothetical protein RQ911_000542 [Pseudomonas aeruginosa]|nr:hypothetical protein [Pseudomonas aeruginosa]
MPPGSRRPHHPRPRPRQPAHLARRVRRSEGLRQLDAADLLEFWPACATSEGWLYRVEQGGWLDQECRREGFVARETKAVDEYFVNGGDRCLSVLSWSPPKVSPLIRPP